MFAREVILAVGLYHATRTRSAPGDEERRVADARRMAEGLRGWWGYWVAHEVESILGDALVQRGRAEDAPEIAERLTAGARGLRGMEAREGADPWLLEARRGRALRRMAGVGHDASVIHLLDQPEILEELRRGIDALELPEVLEAIAASMSSRRGRSERWYAIGAAAAERAAVLPPPPASAVYAARGS